MKLASVRSRRSIAAALTQTRSYTLELFDQIDESCFFPQAHPEFSPIGWHFGHIAFTEAYWILKCFADLPSLFPEYQRLFAADGLPKLERQNLPSSATVREYLHKVRTKTLDYLETASVEQQERLWRWLIQHESQHGETISFIWQLHQQRHSLTSVDFGNSRPQASWSSNSLSEADDEMLMVEAGEFIIGSNDVEALDNERPCLQTGSGYLLDRSLSRNLRSVYSVYVCWRLSPTSILVEIWLAVVTAKSCLSTPVLV